MFSYIRYFAAIALLLVILGSTSIGMLFHSMVKSDLEAMVIQQNGALAKAFTNLIWRPFAPYLAGENKDYMQLPPFTAAGEKFAQGGGVIKLSVLDASGKLLYGSVANVQNGGADVSRDNFGFDAALQGVTSSRILPDTVFQYAGSQLESGTVAQSTHPILLQGCKPAAEGEALHPSCKPEGVISLFVDVSTQWKRIFIFQLAATISIVGIFMVLLSVLIITSRRAEGIIAKQHEVNLELTAAAAAAEAENRDKSQFLASITHELRTPLNAIIGFSDIIRKEAGTTLEKTHRDYINDIFSSGSHLLSLINDILDYSKAEAGKLEVEVTEHDISKIIKNSMRLVIPRAETAQVMLVEDLPLQNYIIETDAKKLKQVLLNLLSNAVKFTPAGGEVKVSAWEDVVDNTVCIEVKDTGIGISPKDISRVMSPFGQVDSSLSRKYEGTGLGLPLSKKFVEILGGVFSLDSEVGVGTKIRIRLPKKYMGHAQRIQPMKE